MLFMTRLSNKFWAKVVIVVHLINHAPSIPLGYQVPKEVWIGSQPYYGHLFVFGNTTYVH